MTKLIFGAGYLGGRVAALWRKAGHVVRIVTRSEDKARRQRSAGDEAVVANLAQSAEIAGEMIWRDVDTVLFAVGFDRSPGETIADVYVRGVQHVLAACPATVRRLIYISSTGVYGASGGEVVDENTPCHPQRDGGQASLEAEEAIRGHALGARSIVLRLGGIYGPDRLPRMQDVVAGNPIAAAEHGWLNLIHVDDAAQIVLDAEDRAVPPNLFVVTDGNPVLRRDFYCEAARLLAAPEPKFTEISPDVAPRQRGGGDKRIDNRRLREQIAPQFQFPSYREGLADILKGDA